MPRVAAIVLAAGEATRFGRPKQRLLLPRVLERLSRAPVDEVVVVAGAYRLDVADEKVSVVECENWGRGPGASLRCGLETLGSDIDAAVVVLADGPDLAPDAVERVLEEWHTVGGIVTASYDGNRGHPLVLGRDHWNDVPDEGLHGRAVRLVPCDDLGSPGDVDTQDDLDPGSR